MILISKYDNMSLDDFGLLLDSESSEQGRQIKPKNPYFNAPVPAFPPAIKNPMSFPTTLMHEGKPVVIQDPVKFKHDLQAMLQMSLIRKMPTDEEMEILKSKASMLEIATISQLMAAIGGDTKAYQYLVDRVLGKPEAKSTTQNTNLNITYEDLLNELSSDADKPFVPSDNDVIDAELEPFHKHPKDDGDNTNG